MARVRSGRVARVVATTVAVCLLALASACAGASTGPTATPVTGKPAQGSSAGAPTPVAPTAAPTQPAKAAQPGKPPAAVKPLDPRVSVKYGLVGSTTNAGEFIAYERGYFKEEGLDVELLPFGSAAESIPALARGDFALASGTISPGYYNAIARGLDLKIVASRATMIPGTGGGSIVVRKDLYDTGVKDASKLKGKTIAINLLANTLEMYVDIALKKAGLGINDVKLVAVPFPDILAALINKSIDAAVLVEPFATLGEEQGILVQIEDLTNVYPYHLISGMMVSPVFAQKYPEAVERFITAYLRGQRDYYDAFQKGTGDKESIIAILIKYTNLKDPAIYKKMKMHAVPPNGRADPQILVRDQEYFLQKKWITEKVDATKLVDMQYVEKALKRLGEYPEPAR